MIRAKWASPYGGRNLSLQSGKFQARLNVEGKAPAQGLAAEVCRQLEQPLGQAHITKFQNDNKFVQILHSVRACDLFVMQPSCHPVDENLMELLLMNDALKRASAGRITAVMPYLPYVRSDKKDQPMWSPATQAGPRTP